MHVDQPTEVAPSERSYSLPETSLLCGVEYRTLHTWVRRGLVRASRRSATGSGSRNELDYEDLVVTKALSDLRRLGLQIDALMPVADELHKADALRDIVVLVNGRVATVDRQEEAAAVAQTAGPVLVLRLAEVRKSLEG